MMVQVGLTTRCNSNCYFCFREELKRAGRKEGNVDFPVEGIKKIIDQDVKDIQLCCNRGESLFHPEIDTIIDMIKQSGSRFEMNTNGDRFDKNWWYDLGQKMTEGDQVIFALDGLKRPHEQYRNTNWFNVVENMKAFIKGGGNAVWQMILFRHNEHQVDLIKSISKNLGCSNTWIINSRYYNEKYRRPKKEYNKTKEDILMSSSIHKDINCRFYYGERVYIDVYGKVWPCCYLKCHFGFKERAYPNNPFTELYEKEKNTIDILNTSLNNIVESKLFKFAFKHMHDSSVHIEELRPHPKKGCLVKHPKYMINFACQLYCGGNNEIDSKNRRDIINC